MLPKWVIPTVILTATFAFLFDRWGPQEPPNIIIQYIQDDKGICFAGARIQKTNEFISITPIDCDRIGMKSHAP
jgi:hypothetical protein